MVSLMSAQDSSNFETFFKATFIASLHVIDTYAQESRAPERSHLYKAALGTALELLDVSGLTLLFSELHGTAFFQVAEDTWNVYLDRHGKPAQIIGLFYLAMDSRLGLPLFTPSAMSRLKWNRAFVDAMAKAGFDTEGHRGPWQGEEEARARHKSCVIRCIYPHMWHMHEHPCAYFAALYLAKRTEASNLELPRDAKECLAQLEREKQRRKSASDEVAGETTDG